MNNKNKLILEGRKAVMEALSNSFQIEKILVKEHYSASLKKIVYIAKKNNIIVQEVNVNKLNSISESNNHQGIIAFYPAQQYYELEDIIDCAKNNTRTPFLIMLDEINDPRNFGAIIRTAEACCVDGIIIPKRRNCGLTGVVSKTSCGALEYVKVARVSNLVSTIKILKENNFWIFGAAMDGVPMYEIDFNMPVVLIIGNEGNGIKKLVLSHCDYKVKIPMFGKIKSLNASVASSILMYEVIRQRNM